MTTACYDRQSWPLCRHGEELQKHQTDWYAILQVPNINNSNSTMIHLCTHVHWQNNGMGPHCSQHTGGVLRHRLCQSRRCSSILRPGSCQNMHPFKFIYLSVFGFGNPWTHKQFWHFFPQWAGPWNTFQEACAKLCIFSNNSLCWSSITIWWHSTIPSRFLLNRISTTPANDVSSSCFNPWDLYYPR